MQVRTGTGWQTVLADLSLILFMTTAAAVHDGVRKVSAQPVAPPPAPAGLPALGEPVAMWSPVQGAPPLDAWLARAGSDPRLRLTILGSSEFPAQALALASATKRPARLVLEPGRDPAPIAALTYDQPLIVARGLQSQAGSAPNGAAAEKNR